MPGLITKKIPWLIQPQYPVAIDQGSPQARDLVGAYCLGITPTLDATGQPALLSRGASSLTPTERGLALRAPSLSSTGIYAPDASRHDLPVSHSLSAWIKPSTTADQVIVMKGQNGLEYGAYGLKIGPCDGGGTAGKINYTVRVGNGDLSLTVTQAGTLALNVWTHVLGTHDGTTLSLYINGVLDATASGNAVAPFNATARLAIGFDDNAGFTGYRWGFTGPLSDIRLYGRKLDAKAARDLYERPWQLFQPIQRNIYVASAGGGITAALTGQAATAGQGSLSPTVSTALTGQAATVSTGTVTVGAVPVERGLTGQFVTVGQGTLTGAVQSALSGQSATITLGAFSPAVVSAITGQSLTVGLGTIAISGGVAEVLTGQAAVVGQGNLSPVVSIALTGHGITVAQGSIVPGFERAITGQSIGLSRGSLQAALSAAMTGQGATIAQGTVYTSTPVIYALTGQGMTLSQGSVSALLSGWVVAPSATGIWADKPASSSTWTDI